MYVNELLELRGLDPKAKVKMVRHRDHRLDVVELMHSGLIEFYQACQPKLIFECDFVASFIGMPRGRARFLGLYEVMGRKKVSEAKPPKDYFLEEDPDSHFYLLRKVPGYDDLEERVGIDWERGHINWHQWLRPKSKEVVEILPHGYARPFPGYLDFILSYYELRRIIAHPESNREWHEALSGVGGIYLIQNLKDGAQYVGSAYGAQGILGRWKDYAGDGHGGNALLGEICSKHKEAHHAFSYSILQTLSKSLTSKEAIEQENLWKKKLGTRAFGLNAN